MKWVRTMNALRTFTNINLCILAHSLVSFSFADCRKKYEQNLAKRQAQAAQARKQAAFAKNVS